MSQVDNDFDLFISVDGLSKDDVAHFIGDTPKATWRFAQRGETPAQIRQKAIEAMVDKYFGIVFVDSDDIMDPARVAVARVGLERYEVIGCALRVVDEEETDLGILFGSGFGDLAELLPRWNIFGLSNTAYRSAILRRCLPLPADCEAVDWLLATRAWGVGGRIGFDDEPRMSYRRHSSNAVPLLPPFTAMQVVNATERVLRHYQFALESGPTLGQDCRAALTVARSRATAFAKSITLSRGRLEAYVSALNALEPKGVWWWCVAHPELEGLWKE
jgi:hypothetical protein